MVRRFAPLALFLLAIPLPARAQATQPVQPGATPGASHAETPGAPGATPSAAATTPTPPAAATTAAPWVLPEETTTVEPAQVLSLAEVVGTARRNPPAVLLAVARARAAEAQVGVARAALLPSVTGTVSGNAFESVGSFVSAGGAVGGASGGSGGLAFSVSGWVDGSLSARWMLWDFGRTALNVEAAEVAVQSARADARAAERVAMVQAAAAYYVLLADNEMVAQLRETVRQRARQLEIARGLVQSGARAPIEQTRAEVALDTARLDLLNAEATARNDAASLAAALALDPSRPVRATRPREIPVDEDPARAADAAVAARPEVTAARARLAQAEAQLAAARAGYRPTLSANASVSVRYTERYSEIPSPNWNGTPSHLGSVALALSVPLFDPTVSANVRAAEANVAAARATVLQQELSVRTEVVQAAIAVRSARQAMVQSERVAAGAAANLAQAEGRYAVGAASLMELVDAQAEDARARMQAVRARLQFELAKVRLLGAVGRVGELEGRS